MRERPLGVCVYILRMYILRERARVYRASLQRAEEHARPDVHPADTITLDRTRRARSNKGRRKLLELCESRPPLVQGWEAAPSERYGEADNSQPDLRVIFHELAHEAHTHVGIAAALHRHVALVLVSRRRRE